MKKFARNINARIIEPVGGHGGMNYYDIGLASGLSYAGVDVTLFTCDTNPPRSTDLFKVDTSFVGVYGKDPAWIRGLRYLRGLWRSLASRSAKGSVKVAHFHFFHVGPLELISVVLARALRHRVVVTAHDVEAFKEGLSIRWLVPFVYSLAHAVIAHNVTSAKEVALKLKVPSHKVHVIPHGNYLDSVGPLPSKSESRAALGIPITDGPVVLFFGQIKEVKGLDVLIQGFADFCKAHRQAKLIIAGRVWKDDFSKYQEIIDRHHLNSNIQLNIRYISDKEVSSFYCAADLVILPYRRIYQSGVLLMAMSYGTPVLVSDLEAMREVVSDGVNGFLFPAGDSLGLSQALDGALKSEVKLSEVSTNALALMREVYGWRPIGSNVATLYRSL